MRIILLGGPGAGKGTQAQKMAEEYSIAHIATGDILRQSIKDGTELGVKAKSYMDKGQLVPDDVVIGIIKERLTQDDIQSGFVLDGFPRTVPQAEALSLLTRELNMPMDAVINIKTSPDVVVERLSGRRTCRDCQTVYHIFYSPPKKEGKCDRCDGELYQRDDDKERKPRKIPDDERNGEESIAFAELLCNPHISQPSSSQGIGGTCRVSWPDVFVSVQHPL